MEEAVYFIHFNDVYEILKSPAFVASIKKRQNENTLTLFSGDILTPSVESTMTFGQHMKKLLKELDVGVAVPGNHDLEFGEDNFKKALCGYGISWVCCNFKRKTDNENICDCLDFEIKQVNGIKIGFFGLIDLNWIETSSVDPDDYILYDPIEIGKKASKKLKQMGCNIIVALTHMRNQTDEMLQEADNDIDIILGGHQHDFMIKRLNEKLVLKSGTNFEMFTQSKITISMNKLTKDTCNDMLGEPNSFYFNNRGKKESLGEFQFCLKKDGYYINIELNEVKINKGDEVDPVIQAYTDEIKEELFESLKTELFYIGKDIDITTEDLRSRENAFTGFMCDLCRIDLGVDTVLLHGGTLRADTVFPANKFFTFADLNSVFPMDDIYTIIKLKGKDLYMLMEQGSRCLPQNNGGFPQIGGFEIVIDHSKEVGKRINPNSMSIGVKGFDMEGDYTLAVMNFISTGKDGFLQFKEIDRKNFKTTHLTNIKLFIKFIKTIEAQKYRLLMKYKNKEKPDGESNIFTYIERKATENLKIHEKGLYFSLGFSNDGRMQIIG